MIIQQIHQSSTHFTRYEKLSISDSYAIALAPC